MFVKKRLAVMLIGILACGGIFLGVHWTKMVTEAAMTMEPLDAPPVIVIDPGHGGFDGGAVGVDGVVEKDINLAIAKKVNQLFQINGFQTVMTRETDRSVEDAGLKTVRSRKNSDIHNRKALADSFDNCVLLSIHQNKFSRSQYFGAQVFYGPKNPESKVMAEHLQARMIELLQPENTRQAKACGDSVYLIYHAGMPALLIECGFLSNPDDASKLSDPGYQDKVAFTIFTSMAESLGWNVQEQTEMEGTGADGGNEK